MKTLSTDDYLRAAARLKVDVATLLAVCRVESRGKGFNPDGSPVILFEGHVFFRYTKGSFTETHPDLCYRQWTRKYYGKTWQEEQDRFTRALRLDPVAALMSTSWGLFQLMGFNYALCGYRQVWDFADAMRDSEGKQLDAFVGYVIHTGLDGPLRQKRWADFAVKYNGANFRANQYDTKLALEYEKASTA
jgi:hypothetical protein